MNDQNVNGLLWIKSISATQVTHPEHALVYRWEIKQFSSDLTPRNEKSYGFLFKNNINELMLSIRMLSWACTRMHMCHGARMKVKEYLAGLCFLPLTPCVLGTRSGYSDLAVANALALSYLADLGLWILRACAPPFTLRKVNTWHLASLRTQQPTFFCWSLSLPLGCLP